MYLPANDPLVRQLVSAAAALPTADVHQHLGPEAPVDTDICRLMVDDNYLCTALTSAGLTPETRKRIDDGSAPLMERWKQLCPYWRAVRHGTYAEAVLTTLRKIYGAQDLTDSEIPEVSARLTVDFAAPGLYRRVLQERSGIKLVLTQGGFFKHDEPRFVPVARPLDRADFSSNGLFEQDATRFGIQLGTAEDVVAAMDAILLDYLNHDVVGFKIAAMAWHEPTAEELRTAWKERRQYSTVYQRPGANNPLVQLYVSRIARLAGERGIPVAVHTGAPWTNWLDFRDWEPTAIIPLLLAYRDTSFDLYHAGLPFGTVTSMMGLDFPNVWLNLTWAHIISAELAMRAIAEWLDLAPSTKVIGFGGDYGNRTVVLTYGHLTIARRNIARVLAWRVKERTMSSDDAEEILRLWFWENPCRLYRLA